MVEDRYAAIHAAYRWHVPPQFNIADVCCCRWATDPTRVALHDEDGAGRRRRLSYAELDEASSRLANCLKDVGVAQGDRVAIVLPQSLEMAITLIACFKLGAVAMPLSVLFGPDALGYRFEDSEALVAVTTAERTAGLRALVDAGAAQRTVLSVDGAAEGAIDLQERMRTADSRCVSAPTAPTDAAVLIYTSGTTGAPKGALVPHQAMIGNLSGFLASQDGFDEDGSVFWSPADWAWTGGLWDALLPTLYLGRTIVGYSGRFGAETAFRLMCEYGVTHTFLFPTALKAMMKAYPEPRGHFDLRLQSIMSAGEAVGETVFNWCQRALGITVNEMFGQTEINYVVGNSCANWPARPGSMGRGYPGHRVAVIDDDGQVMPTGELGEVAVNRFDVHGDADPVFFLGYWKRDDATAGKFTGDWCRTGDLAVCDEDGYLWYKGRADDVFKSAGYRIGPSEVENCLVAHPAVANAAVVPKPDADRGALVKAYVVLAEGHRASDALVEALQAHVRAQLAPYEYPKEIEFIDALPMTTTGKVQRRVLRLQEEARAQSR